VIKTPEETLLQIRVECERLINDGTYALEFPLTTEDEETDSAEARTGLERAVSAAKVLLAYLDASYDFVAGSAEPKEGICLG